MTPRNFSFTATETGCSWNSGHAGVLSSFTQTPARDPARAAEEGFAALGLSDRSVAENARIRCPITRPAGSPPGEKLDRVCFLIHGLNERSWNKYESWAQAIADKGHCAVIRFPIAFHMDRSPASWADFGIMRAVSKDRIARYPGIRQSSMANAAISERLDEAPDRLFLSGLMSARDLGDLAEAVRSGGVPGIAPGATAGFFGYSIGVYLLQCLTLSGEPFASESRRFLFCGGPYLSAMTPVSKFIMDSRAHERIYDFWVRDLGAELEKNAGLAALLDSPEDKVSY